jgi:outer membrane protein TolC
MLTELTSRFSGSVFVVLTCFVMLTGCQGVDVFHGSATASTISTEHAKQNERLGPPSTTQIPSEQQALLNLPSISASIKRIEASRSATSSIALADSLTVSATSNGGVAPNDKDQIEGYVDATVIAEKPLYDGNRIPLRAALSALETKTLLLDLEQQLNTIALDIARQRSSMSLSQDIVDAIDVTLNEYASNSEMLETLVTAGVVQKLEFLDLQQRVQGIEALRHTYYTKILEAESVLTTKYATISSVDTLSVAKLLNVETNKDQSLQAKRFELTQQSLQINKNLKQADKSWGTSFATSLTLKSTSNDPEVFSGLRFTLPIADGGQVDAALESLDSQIVAARADLDAHTIELNSAHNTWEQQKSAFLKAKELNKAQRELVEERQIDLDRQLNAGRAKLDQVIANKLTLLDLEIKNIELTQLVYGQGLEVLAIYGNGCQAMSMCDDFEAIIESLSGK